MTFKERVLTKPGYKFLEILALLFGLFYTLNYLNTQELNNLKNNPNIIVECDIKGEGWKIIDKSKIVSIADDGTFVFTNGYSKSCRVYK